MNATVLGLGVTGLAVVRHLVDSGARVTVLDDAPLGDAGAQVGALGAEVVCEPEPETVRRVVARSDLVVPSPGVRPSHPALVAAASADVPVHAEIDLAARLVRDAGRPVLFGVTGTNGKTTVTALVADLLRRSGRDAAAAGNIGHPLIDAVQEDHDVVVAEVSSFQLHYATEFAPRVAAVLNLAPDHLEWHGGTEAYAAAKARVFAAQAREDVLVYNADDANVVALVDGATSRRRPFSLDPGRSGSWRPSDGALVDPDGREIVALERLRRRRGPDLANALAAAACADAGGAGPDAIAAGLSAFDGFPHRVQLVGEAGGVRYVDDSKATNPHAAVHAAAGFDRVVLLAGGRNKGLDLGALAEAAPHLRSVVAFGEAADEIAEAFGATPVEVRRAATVPEAVGLASREARPGDVVLLAPGCASFDQYESYADRGDDFARAVAELPDFSPASPVVVG